MLRLSGDVVTSPTHADGPAPITPGANETFSQTVHRARHSCLCDNGRVDNHYRLSPLTVCVQCV